MEVLSVTPDADDKARYEAAKKELIQALTKKRAVDRALVRFASALARSSTDFKSYFAGIYA